MLYRKTIKLVTAAILLGLLIFLSGTPFVSSLKNKTLDVLKPILSAALGLRQVLSGSEKDLGAISERAEIEQLRAENISLRRALGFSENKYRLEGSAVFYYRQEFGKEFIFIDKGKEQGIKEGDIVVDSFGFLIGAVKEAFDDGSHVEIISNPGQALEVEILPLGVRALAKGVGARTLALDLLPQGTPIRKGDIVNLLGVGAIRKSLAVGEVVGLRPGNSSFMEVRAAIFSKPENLREVFVVK